MGSIMSETTNDELELKQLSNHNSISNQNYELKKHNLTDLVNLSSKSDLIADPEL